MKKDFPTRGHKPNRQNDGKKTPKNILLSTGECENCDALSDQRAVGCLRGAAFPFLGPQPRCVFIILANSAKQRRRKVLAHKFSRQAVCFDVRETIFMTKHRRLRRRDERETELEMKCNG